LSEGERDCKGRDVNACRNNREARAYPVMAAFLRAAMHAHDTAGCTDRSTPSRVRAA
jgi:hypothetical protein